MSVEALAVTEEARRQECEQRPHLAKVVLKWGAGEAQSVMGFELEDQLGGRGVRIFDDLRLVQNNDVPELCLQDGLVAAQQWIGRQHQVVAGDLPKTRLPVEAMQIGREPLGLPPPVEKHAGRRHHEGGAIHPAAGLLDREMGQCLHGLAEPHVVGEHAAETGRAQELQPVDAPGLIGTQPRGKARRQFGPRDRAGFA
jgi:hypothetical protein